MALIYLDNDVISFTKLEPTLEVMGLPSRVAASSSKSGEVPARLSHKVEES
jgi:hypothetical protein